MWIRQLSVVDDDARPRAFIMCVWILAVAASVVQCCVVVLAEEQLSAASRTDWFHQAGYGVFVHYLSGLQNDAAQLHSLGRETSWDECVAEFNTDAFAATMNEAGAGYVIFTVMQRKRTMIAPNATFDRISCYQPGEACARRDLIDDLYQSLARYEIPLLLLPIHQHAEEIDRAQPKTSNVDQNDPKHRLPIRRRVSRPLADSGD